MIGIYLRETNPDVSDQQVNHTSRQLRDEVNTIITRNNDVQIKNSNYKEIIPQERKKGNKPPPDESLSVMM